MRASRTIYIIALILGSCSGNNQNTAQEEQRSQDTTSQPAADPAPAPTRQVVDEAATAQVPAFDSYADFMKPLEWTYNESDDIVEAGEIPGEIAVTIVFQDGDEIDASDLSLKNKFVDSPEFADRAISEIKFMLASEKKVDMGFELLAMWNEDPSTVKYLHVYNFSNVEPGTETGVAVEEDRFDTGSTLLCASYRLTVYADFKHTIVTVNGACD